MTNFLTDAELDNMRESLGDTVLPDTGNVLSVTYTYDGQGGVVPSWGTATAGVPYRLDYKVGNEPVAGGAVRPYTYWVLTLPHDTTITADHRFEDADGNQYAVSSVDSGKSYKLFLEVMVEKV